MLSCCRAAGEFLRASDSEELGHEQAEGAGEQEQAARIKEEGRRQGRGSGEEVTSVAEFRVFHTLCGIVEPKHYERVLNTIELLLCRLRMYACFGTCVCFDSYEVVCHC